MKQLGDAGRSIMRSSRAAPAPSQSLARRVATYTAENLPPTHVARIDMDLARSLVSAWTPAGGARMLRRAMTKEEGDLVTARVVELDDCLRPTEGPQERDRVAYAISQMYDSFGMTRGVDEERAVLRVQSVMELLAKLPTWAVEKACLRIRTDGVERDGKPCRRYPPNDSELVEMVRLETGAREVALLHVRSILTAEIEPPGALLPRVRPDPAPVRYTPPIGLGADGQHAKRVAADLAKRKKGKQNA